MPGAAARRPAPTASRADDLSRRRGRARPRHPREGASVASIASPGCSASPSVSRSSAASARDRERPRGAGEGTVVESRRAAPPPPSQRRVFPVPPGPVSVKSRFPLAEPTRDLREPAPRPISRCAATGRLDGRLPSVPRGGNRESRPSITRSWRRCGPLRSFSRCSPRSRSVTSRGSWLRTRSAVAGARAPVLRGRRSSRARRGARRGPRSCRR